MSKNFAIVRSIVKPMHRIKRFQNGLACPRPLWSGMFMGTLPSGQIAHRIGAAAVSKASDAAAPMRSREKPVRAMKRPDVIRYRLLPGDRCSPLPPLRLRTGHAVLRPRSRQRVDIRRMSSSPASISRMPPDFGTAGKSSTRIARTLFGVRNCAKRGRTTDQSIQCRLAAAVIRP